MLSRLLRAFGRRRSEAPVTAPPRSASNARAGSAHSDAARRGADIAQQDDPQALYPLCDRERDRAAAIARLAELAASGRAAAILQARPDLGPALLDATSDKALAETLLDAVDNPAELLRIASAASSPHARASAAARLQDDDQLHSLERASRKHDKVVHRLVRERLELRRSLRGRCSAHAEQLAGIAAREAQIRSHLAEPHASGRIEVAERALREWQRAGAQLAAEFATRASNEAALVASLQEELAGLQARATTLAEQLASLHSAALATRSVAAEATPAEATDSNAPFASERVSELANTAIAVDDSEWLGTISALQAIAGDLRGAGDNVLERIAMAPAALELLRRRWDAASASGAPPAGLRDAYQAASESLAAAVTAARRFTAVRADVDALDATFDATPPAMDADAELWQQYWQRCDTLQKAVERARAGLARIAWPSDLPPPSDLAGLAASLGPAEEALAAARAPRQALAERSAALVEELRTLTADGNLRDAAPRLAEARRLLRAQPAADGQRSQAALAPLASQLDELRDWQGFATRPKREALCERMQALADATAEDPVGRADEVKQLRAEWRALGPLADRSERALATRFDADAERAYEPARAHFAAEAAVRAANLAERERVLDTLRGYVDNSDWQKPDWKLAAEVLRVARDEFFSFARVDRSAGRAQTTRFETELARLRGLLDAEYDRNERAKEALTAQAAALLDDAAELAARLDRAKDLQRQWRALGPTRRGPGDALWKRFRQHCDALFATRDTARADAAAAAETAQQQATSLLDAVEARLADAAPITDAALLGETRAALEALTLPAEASRPLQRRWRDLEQRYVARQRDHRRANEVAQWLAWLALHDQLTAAANGSAAWPEPTSPRAAELIDARRAVAADSASGANSAADWREQRLHWVLFAEILAEVDSPEEDRARRMALQVERLAKRSRGEANAPTDFEVVLTSWVAAGHAAEPTERARMEAALRAFLGAA